MTEKPERSSYRWLRTLLAAFLIACVLIAALMVFIVWVTSPLPDHAL